MLTNTNLGKRESDVHHTFHIKYAKKFINNQKKIKFLKSHGNLYLREINPKLHSFVTKLSTGTKKSMFFILLS